MLDILSRKSKRSGGEGQLELFEHLNELRSRITRAIAYIFCGMIVGWAFYSFFFELLSGPVLPILEQSGSTFLLTSVTEGFMIKVQISLFVGVIIALPLLTMEGWGFIAPGLTPSERRALKLVSPLSMMLFVSGVVLAYCVLPLGIGWLIGQNPPHAVFMPSVKQTLLFVVKMLLVFGLVFQMPVVFLFLAKVGLISSQTLKTYWKHSVVGIAVLSAMLTPGDVPSMMMMWVPMVGLYGLSIGLVKIVERKEG